MLHAHSGLRYIVLLFLIVAIVKSLMGWLGKKPFSKSDNIIGAMLMGVTHLQIVLGFVVYFVGGWNAGLMNFGAVMKDSIVRFWTIEHAVIMIVVVVLISIGRIKSKKAPTDELKHKKGAIFYIIALIFILWGGVIKPFAMGRGWI